VPYYIERDINYINCGFVANRFVFEHYIYTWVEISRFCTLRRLHCPRTFRILTLSKCLSFLMCERNIFGRNWCEVFNWKTYTVRGGSGVAGSAKARRKKCDAKVWQEVQARHPTTSTDMRLPVRTKVLLSDFDHMWVMSLSLHLVVNFYCNWGIIKAYIDIFVFDLRVC